MIQFTANESNSAQGSARPSEGEYRRMWAESLLKTAADLLDEEGRASVEMQEQALQLSNEAIGLLAQIRGLQAKSSQ